MAINLHETDVNKAINQSIENGVCIRTFPSSSRIDLRFSNISILRRDLLKEYFEMLNMNFESSIKLENNRLQLRERKFSR